MEKAKMSEENQKMRYKFEKIAKNGPRVETNAPETDLPPLPYQTPEP